MPPWPSQRRLTAISLEEFHAGLWTRVAGTGRLIRFFDYIPIIARQSGTARLPARFTVMLGWAVFFFVLALLAAFFGFSGIAAFSADIAWILLVVFFVLFVLTLIVHLIRGRSPPLP